MILTRLYMYRMSPDNPMNGDMTIEGKNGSVKFNLDDRACAMIVDLMRREMANVLEDVANSLLVEVNAKPVLEHKP